MTNSMRPEDWLNFMRSEYLESFIREGGAAIKFAVPLDEPTRLVLLNGIRTLATDLGYVCAAVSAAETRIHMADQIFFRIAEQVDWEQLSERVLLRLCEEEGYQAPGASNAPFFERVAQKNNNDAAVVRMTLERKVAERVFYQQVLAKYFRVAMTNLCLARLRGGQDGAVTVQTIQDWLTGRNKAISAVKPYKIFSPIRRTNARHLLESLFHWVRFAGYPGTVVVLDIARVTLARNPRDDQPYYTTASLLDAYEVLRQFIDATDRLGSCFLLVVPDPAFLDEDSTGRGIGRYEALKFRVFDEVRALQHVNPMTALVRLSYGAGEGVQT